jgi:thioredoxin-like negative regulator of GroEL
MSIIEQITGSELERAIARACPPYVAWFDGTAETGGMSFVGFVDVMERFAVHLRSIARVVLINVEVWDGTAARYGVIGSPELVLFKDGRKIAHHIGTAPLAGLLLWARPLLAGSTIAVGWSDCGGQSVVGPLASQ